MAVITSAVALKRLWHLLSYSEVFLASRINAAALGLILFKGGFVLTEPGEVAINRRNVASAGRVAALRENYQFLINRTGLDYESDLTRLDIHRDIRPLV